ncbi:uncharacterized protein EV422DRAFT_562654 [Fimicolochytrium jonesii]|uniref:uncharacterized protein n=1 Tax=Fimicolochytrium jonesii TaxID=1396493 RepID=UPI0022FDDDD5|nr:uncharacterized protein EV422DRAFT_562654 [Fimicolochytrium jonesii]KAI8826591.1 hypothetical protein EV422DRAFT_562654 [Fimicolochytrium jonesii]
MYKLYLFRNQITARVLVSRTFRMSDKLLSQIGEHRPSLKLRGDHWVPFAILTGLPTLTAAKSLQSRLATPQENPSGKYRLPLPEVRPSPFEPKHPKAGRQDDPLKLRIVEREVVGEGERVRSLRGWREPEEVRRKMAELCRALVVVPELQALTTQTTTTTTTTNTTPPPNEKETESNPETRTPPTKEPLTLYVERPEWRTAAEEVDGLLWPSFVAHEKLRLVRNRYPDIPGFDLKRLDDVPLDVLRREAEAREAAEKEGNAQASAAQV